MVVGAGVLIAAVIVGASGVHATARGSQAVACAMALLLLASAILSGTPKWTRLADFLGSFGINWLGGYACAAIALAGLHLNFPIADPMLRSADLLLGIDGVAIVETLMRQGQWIFSLMAPSYAYTIPLLTVGIMLLALTGDRVETWRACFCFNGTLFSACLLRAVMPAKGLGLWFGPEVLKHLPDRAARYAFQSFDHFYYGADPELSVDAIEGVVTFPSFHIIMGLMVLAMWRKRPLALGMATGWFILMAFSTFPYGGHYAVDLIGGLLLWSAWFALSLKVEQKAASSLQLGKSTVEPATIGDSSANHQGDDAIAA
jgi:membrane-associated phospholipid phosphatase